MAHAKLQKKIIGWKCDLFAWFPHLNHAKPMDPITPETEVLILPSTSNGQLHGLQKLADIELRLRKGQAYDMLGKLRTSIHIWNYNFEFKQNEVRGQKQNTQAQRFLKTLCQDINTAAATYRRAQVALVHLGMTEDNAVFRPLLDSELYMKNMSKPAKLGNNRKEDPWSWYTGWPGSISSNQNNNWAIESKQNNGYLLCTDDDDDWTIVDRVKWFRDRAACDRAREEKEILESEFDRVLHSFSRMAEAWKALAEQDAPPGYRSYAYQQASLYDAFCSQCWDLSFKACSLRQKHRGKNLDVSSIL